jgi:two-component system CheB/CheR fusion protein
VLEFLNDQGLQHTIRLFATDIDELALTKARAGLYLDSIALDVSPERLQRFFVKVDRRYQINSAIRELCVFANHNLYQDPPFSNLDLISCRNVIIYLDPVMQRRVIPLFHYALQPSGVLTLGPSESIGPFTDLFAVTNHPYRIFTKKPTALPTAVDLPPHRYGGEARDSDSGHPPATSPSWPTFDVCRESDRVLLSQYAPAAVLVNAEMEILQFRGDTNRYLRAAQGKATLNLFRMARDGLLRVLRAALESVQRTGVQVRQEGARVRIEQAWQEVTIRVIPLTLPTPAPSTSHYLVVFEEPIAPVLPAGAQPRYWRAPPPPAEPDPNSQWQQELEATRLYLHALMEQHEATTEELTAANEEVISSNEELQSTNEELETAKEELQSMNEELLTTNDELRHRNLDLSETNTDLTNLFSSVHLPIIMVDHDLRIRRFTATAETILQLIPADTGRPIRQLRLNIALPELESLILQVITTGIAHDCEVQDREGHWYSLRIRPYRTREETIDGAVLVLIDIDSLKNVDRLTLLLEEVQRARKYAEAIVHTIREPLVILDRQLYVRTANRAFYQTFDLTPEATEQHSLFDVGYGQWDLPRLRELLEQIIPLNTEMRDFDVEYTFPTLGTRTMRLNARCLVQDHPSEALILLAIDDLTERTRAHD